MSDKKQWRLPKIVEKREKREDGRDVNPNKKVHAGDIHDLLTSHKSKPVVYGCTLPQIINGQLMKRHTSNIMKTGSGKVAPTHFPPLPVKGVAQQQVKTLSKRSSASSLRLDSQHPQLRLPMLPSVVKQDCSNKEGSQLKWNRQMPVHLPPIENVTQSSFRSSWSAGHKPETAVLRTTTELSNIRKLPDIKNAQVKCFRPKSRENLHRLPCVLPPIFKRKEDNRNLKLPPTANVQGAKSPRAKIFYSIF